MRRAQRGPIDLHDIHRRLLRRRGPAGWWPAANPFEVCVGAILVQNTAWTNVEKALSVLRSRDILSFAGLDPLSAAEIAPLIRSAGCFNVKARRLRAFLDFLGREYGGRVEAMEAENPRAAAREAACRARDRIAKPPIPSPSTRPANRCSSFDAYTRRVFGRLGAVKGDEPYDALQRVFMDALPAEAALFNEYHAQIVIWPRTPAVRGRIAPAAPWTASAPR
jgi:endonuclease-3 related protein